MNSDLAFPKYWTLHTSDWRKILVWWDSFTKVSTSIWRDVRTKNDRISKEKIDEFNKMAIPPDIIVDVSTHEEKWNEIYDYLTSNFKGVCWISPHLWISHQRSGPIDWNQILERIDMFWEKWIRFIYIMPHVNKDIIELSRTMDRLTTTSLSWWIIISDMIKFWVENLYAQKYDSIMKLAKKHNIAVAIWWVFRPSNIQESLDKVHLLEIQLQEQFIKKAADEGVTVIRQWPWHMPLSDIPRFVELINKEIDVPYMSLWPLVSDYISVWYDSYSNAIWAYELWRNGKANIINAVTDEEHTWEIPKKDSSVKWYIAARITAYLINSILAPDQIKNFEHCISVMKNAVNTCKMSSNPIIEWEIHSVKECNRCWVWELCPCNIWKDWISITN